MWRCRMVSVRGCWQTVPTDASCASLELSQGWGIHDVGRGSSCFWTLWRVLGASQVFIPEIHAGAYFVARYQPEDFDPILDGVRAHPILDGGGGQKSPPG